MQKSAPSCIISCYKPYTKEKCFYESILQSTNISRKLKDDFSLVFLTFIECIFKSQKSNGFRLEATNTQKIEHFISLFTVMCIALVWLTILGVDYSRNKSGYHLKIRDIRKTRNRSPVQKNLFLFCHASLQKKRVNFTRFSIFWD